MDSLFDTKPVTGEVMVVLPSVIFSSSRRAFDCASLRAGESSWASAA